MPFQLSKEICIKNEDHDADIATATQLMFFKQTASKGSKVA